MRNRRWRVEPDRRLDRDGKGFAGIEEGDGKYVAEGAAVGGHDVFVAGGVMVCAMIGAVSLSACVRRSRGYR